MEGSGQGTAGNSKVVSVALQVLGAAAGIAALATFVGGATLWLRFEALHLPADRAVAVLPTELLVVVGAHALIAPVGLGIVALLLLVVIDQYDDQGGVRPGFAKWMLRATVVLVVVAFAWLALTVAMDLELLLIGMAGAVVAITLIGAAVRDKSVVRYIGWIAFAVFALYGALLGVLNTAADPRMEPVAALLTTEDRGLAGFFVGETPERLWFVSLPGNADPGEPRDQVTTIVTREAVGVGPGESGREQAHTLLADLRFTMQERRTDTTVEPVITGNPEIAFAPLVHLHSQEALMPMSAREFIENSTLRWSNRGSSCGSVTIAVGKSRREDAPKAPPIDEGALGPTRPYVHAQDAACADDPRPISAIDRTRPYEKTRPKGLALEQGFFLDLHKDAQDGHHEIDDQGPRSFLRNVPVYADTELRPKLTEAERELLPPSRTKDAMRITYWMFYGLSQPPRTNVELVAHEGDWERISVLLIPPDPEAQQAVDPAAKEPGASTAKQAAQKKGYLPVAAGYHHHNESRQIPWYAVKRVVGDTDTGASPTHPVVYSAKGSHASYWQAGRFETIFKPLGRRLTVANDVAISCPKCPQWQTWKIVLPAREQLWYGFGGAWGKVGLNGDTTGPLGPSEYKLGRNRPVKSLQPDTTLPLPSAPSAVEDLIQAE
jgi:hypothetical protein